MARKRKAAPRKMRTEKELLTLRQRLDALLARAKRTERQVEKAYVKQRQALRVRQAKAQQALQRLRRRSAAAAPPLKSGLQRAWADLNAAVKEAASRFRGSS
jgi:hypothetical protein